MDLKFFEILDEQNIICFTGKLNLLKPVTRELVGTIFFIEGQITNAKINRLTEMKALMNIFVYTNENPIETIIEPELVASNSQKIDFPIGVLKVKAIEYIEQFNLSKGMRPPNDLKLVPRSEFVLNGGDVTPSEFSLLTTMANYNLVEDIYIHNSMLEFEITNTLITLRKKEAIKVVETK